MAHNTAYAVCVSTFFSFIPANYSGSSPKKTLSFSPNYQTQASQMKSCQPLLRESERRRDLPTKPEVAEDCQQVLRTGGHLDCWTEVTEFCCERINRGGEERRYGWAEVKRGEPKCVIVRVSWQNGKEELGREVIYFRGLWLYESYYSGRVSVSHTLSGKKKLWWNKRQWPWL